MSRLYFFRLEFSPGYARFPFVFEGAAVPGMGCLISSRAAGDMLYDGGKDTPQREALFRSLGKDGAAVYGCRQRHSREVQTVDGGLADRALAGDGLVAADRRISLSVTVADCLPVFLYDTRKSAAGGPGPFALLHSGWRGTGIVLEALRIMGERWGSRSADMAAVLGPCIRGCCYRVDAERAEAFEAEFGGTGGAYPLGPVTRRAPQPLNYSEPPAYYINLQAANARLLANAGVGHIAVCEDCTFTDERLGSFRREGAAYTRMIALLGCFDP
ncbi:MAG: polyphenol oxidase family protein [Treponema sp.]|jgi:YfiH family protein|nr:polyphenol oxidase family protein [Treponema sp.]